jgi:glucose-6-phosphate isomerase
MSQQGYKFFPTIGFGFDFSNIALRDDDEMKAKFDRAFQAMVEIEKGAIANTDEKRMVGHYWLRTPEISPTAEIRSAIEKSVADIEEFSEKIHNGKIVGAKGKKFQNLIVVGIGGSALGPQLLVDAFESDDQKMNFFICDNTDPDGINRTLGKLAGKLDETLVVITSKSGGTIETRNGEFIVGEAYRAAGLDFSKHACAITSSGSKLSERSKDWIQAFEMWDWVGGRMSLFSAVGLLPAALLGHPFREMLKGASLADALTRVTDISENPSALMALAWYTAGKGKGEKDMVILPYKDRLVLMSKYLQQLVMESLGKEFDLDGKVVNQGIAVYGNKGSTDQHAYVQQLRDGVPNFFATFIGVLKDEVAGRTKVQTAVPYEVRPGITAGDYLISYLAATREALKEKGRESFTIVMDALTPQSFGALIALYERAVGYYANLIHINAYHQPGVEAGKKGAEVIVEAQLATVEFLKKNSGKSFSSSEIAETLNLRADQVFWVLEHLAANARGVVVDGERNGFETRYKF